MVKVEENKCRFKGKEDDKQTAGFLFEQADVEQSGYGDGRISK